MNKISTSIMIVCSIATLCAAKADFNVLKINGNDKFLDCGNFYLIAKNDPEQLLGPVLTMYNNSDSVIFAKTYDVNVDGQIITSMSACKNGTVLITSLNYSPNGDDARKTICFNKFGKTQWEIKYPFQGGEAEISPNGKFVIITAGIKFEFFNAITGKVVAAISFDSNDCYIGTFDSNDNAIIITGGTLNIIDSKSYKNLKQVKLSNIGSRKFHVGPKVAEDVLSASPEKSLFACVMMDGKEETKNFIIVFDQNLSVETAQEYHAPINNLTFISKDRIIVSAGPLKDRSLSARFSYEIFDVKQRKVLASIPGRHHKISNAFEDLDGIHFISITQNNEREGFNYNVKNNKLLKTQTIPFKMRAGE